MSDFRVDVSGDRQLRLHLARIGRDAQNCTPLLTALADDFLGLERRQFDTEGSFASGGWAPLAESTLRWKQAMGYPSRILVATGRLRASLISRTSDSIRRITPRSMDLGTKVPYFTYHQTGTRRMPRRRPVEVREQDRRRWGLALQRFLMTGDVEVPSA